MYGKTKHSSVIFFIDAMKARAISSKIYVSFYALCDKVHDSRQGKTP